MLTKVLKWMSSRNAYKSTRMSRKIHINGQDKTSLRCNWYSKLAQDYPLFFIDSWVGKLFTTKTEKIFPNNHEVVKTGKNFPNNCFKQIT